MNVNVSQNPSTVVTIATPGPKGPPGPAAPAGDLSGSLQLTGSLSVSGNGTGSFVDFSNTRYVTGSFTGSFKGDGSAITGITASIQNSASFAVITGPNQFTGSQFVTGSIIPEALGSGNGLHDLGSVNKPWRDLYLTTASLKFVKDAVVIADMNGENGGVRIGNIFIGTGSISVVSGSGNNMTTVSNVVEVNIDASGSIEKVIEQYVTASGAASITGSLTVSGSDITVLGGTFVGDGSGLTGITASLPNGVISSSTQLDNLGYVQSNITSSSIITSSANLNVITFTKGDGSTFAITVNTGSGGGGGSVPSGTISSSTQISNLGFISSSGNIEFSGSTSFTGDTSFTGSTVMSGSLIITNDTGLRVEGNTIISGSNVFQGTTTVEGNSMAINTILTVTDTSSFKSNVNITGSLGVTGGITGSLQGTASLSSNSILLNGKNSATFATTGSNDFKASQYISGSVIMAPSEDPGTSNLNATYLFTSASNFSDDECDFYYRNKGVLWDQEWLEYGVVSGLIYGGVVTFSGANMFISPGGGLVVNYNASTGSAAAVVPTQVKWGPITASATYLTSSQYSHIFIDENGNLQQQIEDFTTSQYLEKIPLGTLGHLTNNYIDAFGEEKQTTYAGPAQANQFIRSFGPLKQQGYDLSAIGSTLGFSTEQGITFKLGGFYSKDPNNPSVYDTPSLTSTGRTVRVYRSGSNFIGDINGGSFYNVIDPTKYDDGSGTLATISGSTTTIQRVYLGPTSERFYVYYGQATYDSIPSAVSKLSTEQFTESLTTSKSLTFVGYLVVRADATDLSDINQANLINGGLFRNTVGGSGGGTSTISNLGEITDVNIIAPSSRQYLEYDAGIWRNRTIEFSDIDSGGSQILSSSAQLETLGVTLSSGSTTEFDGSVVISGSGLSVTGSVSVEGSLLSPVVSVSPTYQPTGWVIVIDPTEGNFFEATVQQSAITTITITNTNSSPGQTINLKLTQNSTNPGTIAWSSNVKFADGADTTISTGAGDVDVWSLITWDGTDYYATGLKNFS